MNKKILIAVLVVVLLAIVGYIALRQKISPGTTGDNTEYGTKSVKVVAAENFYGDIAKQLGGEHVSVTSILSDPNVDPHEYESNVQDAVAITNADIVIENGLEYDTWMDKLLSASPNPARILITAGNVAMHPLPDNPHVWYGIDNAADIARSITDALANVDPTDAQTFRNNLASFNAALLPIQQKMTEIKTKYAGTPVGLTETIYLYETQPMGLNVLTPFEFEKAIAEGNDPPAASVKVTNGQVNGKQVKVLIYNSQTVTPITMNLQNAAKEKNIPVVAVTETMPPNATYQSWIMDELMNLEQGLAQATGH